MKRVIIGLILSTLSVWGQSVTISTSSTIQDTAGVVATSGYVEFDLSPSGPFYRVVGTGVLVTNINRCGIDATGHVKNIALSAACLVWGTDVIQPANACYNITYAPGTGTPYTVSNVSITGTTVDLSNPTFCSPIKLIPDYVTVTTMAQNGNIMPSASHIFSIGSSGLRYAQGWFDTINATTYGASPQFITPNFITGFQIGGAAPTGHVPRGNGTYYVDAQLAGSDLAVNPSFSGMLTDQASANSQDILTLIRFTNISPQGNFLNFKDSTNTVSQFRVDINGQIAGKTDGSDAAAGYIGEFIQAKQITPQALTTSTNINVVSVSLTAGDWDVSGAVAYTGTSTTLTAQVIGISNTSLIYSPAVDGSQDSQNTTRYTTLANGFFTVPMPTFRVSINSTTTYYLVTQAVFASGTCLAQGYMRARRVR